MCGQTNLRASDLDVLFVRGLRIDAILGILPAERAEKQPVIVDLEYAIDTTAAVASGDIADTVSYASAADSLTQWIVEGEFELVETLASVVAERLQSTYGISWLRMRVTKPLAVPKASGVGIEIERGLR